MSNSNMRIGVLALQGAIEEHVSMTKLAFKSLKLEGEVLWVKNLEHLEEIQGLIIPGGESTVMGRLLETSGLLSAIKKFANESKPVLGTCSGMVLLAKEVYDRVVGKTSQPTLKLMDITVERNAFGRQGESFEEDLEIQLLGEKKFKGVFIRSPVVQSLGDNVKPICYLNGRIVAVQQQNILATSFHPELTDDTRLHEFFLKKVTK
ncbi:MAG: pyridoxal 5'-phosphate synthase glutaminase subunit PdxT [Candidatus Jordarchaeum sp.]|uniref:pyridoxal 5'-phosphate synthase glutaminase subunit PdxT n=1 Tax=Candidatus Jordarchaeum sp. TaxID=2823881 RepID=UPI00404B5B13